MTISLTIDTSTSRTCVAIIEDGATLWTGHRDGATAHGPALPALVQDAIAERSIDEVVVGMGPGPFTGLRIGIAFAQSFALAREIPLRGACSLDAIAAQVDSKDFIITVDARRKEVYWARYKNGVRVSEPAVNFPAAVGSEGADIYAGLYPDLLAMVALTGNITEPMYLRHPDAVAVVDRQMITYRGAMALDLPTFVSLDKQLFPYSPWSQAQYREEFENNTRHFVVALDGGMSIVGYAGVFLPSAGVAADILTVGVTSEHRRQGIARKLMALITDWAVAHGASAMILEVKTDNGEAIALYESLGYEKLNVRQNYFGTGLDALVMRIDFP